MMLHRKLPPADVGTPVCDKSDSALDRIPPFHIHPSTTMETPKAGVFTPLVPGKFLRC